MKTCECGVRSWTLRASDFFLISSGEPRIKKGSQLLLQSLWRPGCRMAHQNFQDLPAFFQKGKWRKAFFYVGFHISLLQLPFPLLTESFNLPSLPSVCICRFWICRIWILIDICIVLWSSLHSDWLFGRKDSIFVTLRGWRRRFPWLALCQTYLWSFYH